MNKSSIYFKLGEDSSKGYYWWFESQIKFLRNLEISMEYILTILSKNGRYQYNPRNSNEY